MTGRRRIPLAGSGRQAELAQRLRGLRDASGLTLRQLAAKSGYSPAALSQAESGRTVPSWDLVAAFAQTCGEDPVRWRHQWELARATPIATEQDRPPVAAVPYTPPAVPPRPAPDRNHRRSLIVGMMLLIGTSAAIVARPTGTHPHSADLSLLKPSPAAQTAARDNTDPYADGCRRDEKTLDSQQVYRRNGRLFGTIVLVYSRTCRAEWGYLDAPNSTQWTIHINSYRIPGSGTTRWHFSGTEDFGSWDNVLSTQHGCVYAEAYVSDEGGEGPHVRTACIQP